MTKVLIIGGGFGGIRTALTLAKRCSEDFHVTLVSDRSHFEYHATLYRVVTGKSPLEVCIPLRDIFAETKVEVSVDTISHVDLHEKCATGASGSHYNFDHIVLALGSETNYFNIPGLKELSFGFKSTNEALRLKNHIRDMFASCSADVTETDHLLCALNFVVVGGGMSGVELSAELALYARQLAREYAINPSFVTINLIEAGERILPALPEKTVAPIEARLRQLGIVISTHRSILQESDDETILNDMRMKTKTVIWTAGATPHHLYRETAGLAFDERGRVRVDEYLRAVGFEHVYIIGDAAATQYSGMAQTAIFHGQTAARNILRTTERRPLRPHTSRAPIALIPVGSGWALAQYGGVFVTGRIGWWLRRLFDFTIFFLHLPIKKSVSALRDADLPCEQ